MEVLCIVLVTLLSVSPASAVDSTVQRTDGESHLALSSDPSKPENVGSLINSNDTPDRKFNSTCCHNGGKCILGSFCFCKKNFFGRHCEHELVATSCGSVSHGSWVESDCNLCRCFNGYFICVPKILYGCDDENKPFDPNQKIDPMTGKKIKIIPDEIRKEQMQAMNLRTEDYEYADYYEDSVEFQTKRSSAVQPSAPVLVVLIILFPLSLTLL